MTDYAKVDEYLVEKLLPKDAALDAALASNREAGLPTIDVAPNQGKLLSMLAQIQGAKDILEIGTLGGYSTIWLARAVPAGGRVVTMEYEPKHADVARKNVARAGLEKVVDIRVGAALDSLAALAKDNPRPFDFVFIDADKSNNPNYLEWALKLTKVGSLIVVDNVVRSGRVLEADSTDSNIVGTRKLFDAASKEKRIEATAVQTVGSKGHDGFLLARVVRD